MRLTPLPYVPRGTMATRHTRFLVTTLLNWYVPRLALTVSTIRQADQILVLDAGRIVQRGTHERLLAEGGLYRELYHTQFADQAAAGSAAHAPG